MASTPASDALNNAMLAPAVILIVEDREDDALLMCRAFARCSSDTAVHVLRDAPEAISYLSGAGKYASREEYPLPALILLDLHLPGMDGFELLAWIRKKDGIRTLPVVVLTSSDRVRDVKRAYDLGANSFFV